MSIITTVSFPKALACVIDGYPIDTIPITKGAVIDVESQWNETKTGIETLISIEVDSTIKDSKKEILQLAVPGGVIPEEGIALIVSGQDQFNLGDQVSVFSEKDFTHIIKNSAHCVRGDTTDIKLKGFTHYCYDSDTMELACDQDLCESTISWPRSSIPVTYYSSSSFSTDQIEAIINSMETWNKVHSLFKGIYSGITEVNEVAPDGINLIRIADEGEIPDYQLARCYLWTNIEGEIFDADISLNPHYIWGVSGNSYECDIQNILTHEFGHFIGLGDIYEPDEGLYISCMGGDNQENTMYGYSGRGEIKKRTLSLGDLVGIQSLYGCAVTIALDGDEEALNTIRHFINSFLARTEWGKNFINYYYDISPQLSKYFYTNPKMKHQAEKIIYTILPILEELSSFKGSFSE